GLAPVEPVFDAAICARVRCRSVNAAEQCVMLNVEGSFWDLCDRAHRHAEAASRMYRDDSVSPDDAHLETQASERAMIEIIELVEANPEHRDTFVRCFSAPLLWKW